MTQVHCVALLCLFLAANASPRSCLEGFFAEPSGVVASNAPGEFYAPFEERAFVINPDGDDIVSVNFTRFNLHPTDSICVHDGTSTSGPLLGCYTGTIYPPSMYSAVASALYLKFVADGVGFSTGYSISYSTNRTAPAPCAASSSFTLGSSGVEGIASHDGAGEDGIYALNRTCTWTATASSSVLVRFTYFRVDPTDSIVAYDNFGVEVMRLRGMARPPAFLLPSASRLEFVSDGGRSHAGFAGTMEAGTCGAPACSGHGTCSGDTCACDDGWNGAFCDTRVCMGRVEFSAATGAFTSNGEEGSLYPNDWWCAWVIPAPSSAQVLVLSFERFDLEKGKDSVRVHIGDSEDDPLRATFSGAGIPPPLVITSVVSPILVTFTSDSATPRQGFSARYRFRDSAASVSCPSLCSGNGRCVDGACVCYVGYQGQECETAAENCNWLPVSQWGVPPPAMRGAVMVAGDTTTAFLLGGRSSSSYNENVYTFNALTGEWRRAIRTLPLPPGRTNAGATRLPDGKIFLFGGIGVIGNVLNDTWVYDPVPGTWEVVASAGAPTLYSFGICTLESGTVVIVGGMGTSEATSHVYTVDIDGDVATYVRRTTAAEHVHGPVLPPIYGHTATAFGNTVVVAGGFNARLGRESREMWVLSEEFTWDRRAPGGVNFPARYNHGASGRLGTQMVLHGGLYEDAARSDTWLYDLNGNFIVPLDDLGVPPRSEHMTCSLGAKSVVFGGVGPGMELLSDVWVLWDHPPSNASTIADAPASVVAGESVSFTIQSRDLDGRVIKTGGNHLLATVFTQTLQTLVPIALGTVVDNRDGTYTVTVSTTQSGEKEVHVLIRARSAQDTLYARGVDILDTSDMVHIAGSPFVMVVENAPVNPALSSASPDGGDAASFTLRVRDEFNNVHSGEVAVTALLRDKSNATTTLPVESLGDGNYRIDYSAAEPGAYAMEVYVNGTQVRGSPYDVVIAEPAEEKSYVGIIVAVSVAACVLLTCVLVGVGLYIRHRRLNPPWRIQANQLTFGEKMAEGTFAEVFIGDYKGYTVAIKRLRTSKELKEHIAKTGDGGVEMVDIGEDEEGLVRPHTALNTTASLGTTQTAGGAGLRAVTSSFKSEITMISKLQHPNVLLFYGATTERDNRCIVTEYMEMGSLYDILHNDSIELGWKRRTNIVLQASLGVDYLHQQRPPVLHKDIKSLNFLLDRSWRVKVADFGLTGVQSRKKTVGTLMWSAPEVLKGDPPTTRSDVYSFAIVIWEVCTRKLPYHGLTEREYIDKVIVEDYRPLLPPEDDRPLELDNVITESWKLNSQARPSFAEIVSRLQRIHDHVPDDVRQTSNVGAETLLRKVFTENELQASAASKESIARDYSCLSLLYSDIVGFTNLSAENTPFDVAVMINKLFTKFDAAAAKWNVDKIETIGDAYIACAGLGEGETKEDAAYRLCEFGRDMIRATKTVPIKESEPTKPPRIRVGIHSGPVTGTVVGTTQRKLVWAGTTVPIAERMESGGIPARVHISADTYKLVKDRMYTEPRPEKVHVHELGQDVQTYILEDVPDPSPEEMDLSGAAGLTEQDIKDVLPNQPPPVSLPPLPQTNPRQGRRLSIQNIKDRVKTLASRKDETSDPGSPSSKKEWTEIKVLGESFVSKPDDEFSEEESTSDSNEKVFVPSTQAEDFMKQLEG